MNAKVMKVATPVDDTTEYTCSAGADCRAPDAGLDGWRGTAKEYGFRKDGRRNTRCRWCRAALAAAGAQRHHQLREERQIGRDLKALRVIERATGLRYRETRGWTTPEAIAWQWQHGIMLQELWTDRMRRLAERADRCAAARRRIAERQRAEAAA